MEEESNSKGILAWALGALGLGAIVTAVAVPKVGIWIALGILLLAVLIFGAYLLFRRLRARRQSRSFEGAVQAQASASAKNISDPNRRAALDKLRQKFQTGLNEFKSRGKDIYQLPWYVIIGEPGSGKSEAIRHSGVEFPPGLQDELQGSGGTINMDWWFTNRSVILDTAGSMIFSENATQDNPEWKEFLRLLKRARAHCPINGLFLVLSVESLIKDSSEKIAAKASRLAQQMDLIQRTLDVRFPVYLLVTKCDLLTGFNEFFDSIDDPLLQHQMFGWSNPEELDTPFRPDLVENHLKTVAERLRRRRLALLREQAGSKFGETQFFTSAYRPGTLVKRRLDEVDGLFALPESVMRLAPRLRRYLETIFVAGEWSAKPVFLRGIYFTSSMREGHALDEATALALGVPVEQLPEDRQWEKNRSFFMRDLFMEKVFREYGLVTRATNTMKLVRQRRLLIFGTASVALILLLAFSLLAYRGLKRSVLTELSYWQAGTTNWVSTGLPFGIWQPSIVRLDEASKFVYAGEDKVPGTDLNLSAFHVRLQRLAEQPLEVSWVFLPMTWFAGGKDLHRREAQELLFEGGVVRPLVYYTRQKMMRGEVAPGDAALAREREALLSLIRLEADAQSTGGSLAREGSGAAARYLTSLGGFLTDANLLADTNLVQAWFQTYSAGKPPTIWPPSGLLGGGTLKDNAAISQGLDAFKKANESAQQEIENSVKKLNDFADGLKVYRNAESDWLAQSKDWCGNLAATVPAGSNYGVGGVLALAARYKELETAANNASSATFREITNGLADAARSHGIFLDIDQKIRGFAAAASQSVRVELAARTNFLPAVDGEMLAAVGGQPAYLRRWALYRQACQIADKAQFSPDDVGQMGARLNQLKLAVSGYRSDLGKYDGPLADKVNAVCGQIAGDVEARGRGRLLDAYAQEAAAEINNLISYSKWNAKNFEDSSNTLARIGRDLNSLPGEADRLNPVGTALLEEAKSLYRRAGFPLFLNGDSASPMSLEELAAVRNFSGVLLLALQDDGWRGVFDASGREQAKTWLAKFRQMNKTVNALVNADGQPVSIKISFLPPREGTGDEIIRVFRQANVVMGQNQSGWQELAQHIGQSPMVIFKDAQPLLNDGLQIQFRKLANDNSPVTAVKEPDWGLIRLIAKQAADSDDQMQWRVKVKLSDDNQGIKGVAEFEVQIAPLPKVSDWPQQ